MTSGENFYFEVDWNEVSPSAFDADYDHKWLQKMKDGRFRYTLDGVSSKLIAGERNSYFVQLNVNRAVKKRDPQCILDVRQPFDANSFNFTRIEEVEVMFRFEGKGEEPESLIVINVSPLEEGHTLLLPHLSAQLPQIITKDSLKFAINVVLSSRKPSFRAGFNGMLAFATVNHLHFHAYNLNARMPLETMKVTHLVGRCYVLERYPSKGFAFEIRSIEDVEPVVSDIVRITDVFLDHQFPHNLYITRGLRFDQSNESTSARNCLRVYLWARTPSSGLKDLSAFNPALCELFGHILVKDADSFAKIDEQFLEETLESITLPMFQKALPLVKSLLSQP